MSSHIYIDFRLQVSLSEPSTNRLSIVSLNALLWQLLVATVRPSQGTRIAMAYTVLYGKAPGGLPYMVYQYKYHGFLQCMG